MKGVLFIGGIKSGKSKNAEIFALQKCKRPIYLATSELFDDEMREKADLHKKQRGDRFETIEEPLKLYERLKGANGVVLVECVSVWINNMLHYGFGEDEIITELERLFTLNSLVVFVINDVSSGILPINDLARRFININGIAAQLIASNCDEVYHTVAGISVRIK